MIIRTLALLKLLAVAHADKEVQPENTCLLQSHNVRDANSVVDAGGDATLLMPASQTLLEAVEVEASGTMVLPSISEARSALPKLSQEVDESDIEQVDGMLDATDDQLESDGEVRTEAPRAYLETDGANTDASTEATSLEEDTSTVEAGTEALQSPATHHRAARDASTETVLLEGPPVLSTVEVKEQVASDVEIETEAKQGSATPHRVANNALMEAMTFEGPAALSVLPLSSHMIDGLVPVEKDSMLHTTDEQTKSDADAGAEVIHKSVASNAQGKDVSSWVNDDQEAGTEIVQGSDAPQGRGPVHGALLQAQRELQKMVSHATRNEALWVISLGVFFVVVFVALVVSSALAMMNTKKGPSRPGSPEKTPRTPRSLFFFAGKSAQLPSAPTLSTSSWQGSPASTCGSWGPTPRSTQAFQGQGYGFTPRSSSAGPDSARRGRLQSEEDDLWTATPPDTARPACNIGQRPASRASLCPALAVPEGGNGSLLAVPFFRGVPVATRTFESFVLDASGQPNLRITLESLGAAGRPVERLLLADAQGRALASCLCNASPSRILSADGSTHALVIEQTESAAATGGRSFTVNSPAGGQLLEVHGREGGQSFVFRSPGRSAAALAEPGFEKDGREFYWLRVAAGVDLVSVVLTLLCVDRLHATEPN